MMDQLGSWLSRLWGGGAVVIEQARLRDAARLAQLHGASFHRGWGESEFEGMLTERNTLVHRLKAGRKIMSAAARAKIAAAQKARWAKAEGKSAPSPVKQGKRKMSAAAKARLSQLAKARWAKVRAAGKKKL